MLYKHGHDGAVPILSAAPLMQQAGNSNTANFLQDMNLALDNPDLCVEPGSLDLHKIKVPLLCGLNECKTETA